MKFLTAIKNRVSSATKKVAAVALSACMAVSMLAMSAFAESGASASGVYDTVTSSMTSELTSLVSKAGVAIAGVVGVGLVIFGVKWLVGVLKSFFKKLAS